jgi:hypothetical protein
VPAHPDDDSNPILADAEVTCRMLLLAELQAELTATGTRAVLARNHRLVLRYNDAPLAPSGLTDPCLHIMLPAGTRTATTDGTSYRTSDGTACPVTDIGIAQGTVIGAASAAPGVSVGTTLEALAAYARRPVIIMTAIPMPLPVNAGPVMPSTSPPDLDLSLLAFAYPAFTITCHPYTWREPRWEAVRKHGTDPGLYAVITPELGELLSILTTAQPAEPPELGTR